MGTQLRPDQVETVRGWLARLVAREGSQNKLAAALGVHQSNLSRLLKGTQGASHAFADEIARLVGEPPLDCRQVPRLPTTDMAPVFAKLSDRFGNGELAQLLGVDRATISRIAHAKQRPSARLTNRALAMLAGPGEPAAVAPPEADRIAALEQRVAALEAAQRAAFRFEDANSDSMAVEN